MYQTEARAQYVFNEQSKQAMHDASEAQHSTRAVSEVEPYLILTHHGRKICNVGA